MNDTEQVEALVTVYEQADKLNVLLRRADEAFLRRFKINASVTDTIGGRGTLHYSPRHGLHLRRGQEALALDNGTSMQERVMAALMLRELWKRCGEAELEMPGVLTYAIIAAEMFIADRQVRLEMPPDT